MRRFQGLGFLYALLAAVSYAALVGCQSEQSSVPEFTGPPPAALTPRAVPGLSVWIDGKEASPRLQFLGTREEGDAYLLDVGIALALGSGRELRYSWEGRGEELLYLEEPGQPKRLVGVRVKTSYEDTTRVKLNPLANLNEEAMRGLWGVEIEVECWSEEIAKKVALLDFANCWLTVTNNIPTEGGQALPPLPAGLRMLRVQSYSRPGLENLDALKDCSKLVALSVQGLSRTPLDSSLWQRAKGLTYLDLSGQGLRKPELLASHSALQVLDLKYCDGVADLSFVRSLRGLEELNVSRTKVTDLSPLSGLPRLRKITANMTPARRLPSSLTNLQEIAILSSKVREADAKAFREAHPQADVKHGWTDTLISALKDADRLRIRSGGTCHRNEAQEQTLFETADPNQIKVMVASIEVVDERSGFHCMCCGDPSLEFYQGNELLATVGFHHGQGLRWIEGWPGDAALAPKSASFLVDWLSARNVRGPSVEKAAEAERESAAERKLAQATTGMSPGLAKAFTAGPARFKAALAREIPDKKGQVTVWLRVLGTSNGSWSELDSIEQGADEALKSYDATILASAASSALVGEDRQLRRGAARLWMSWQSPLEDWMPSNVVELHRIVLQVQQEAHYYPLRLEALNHLAAFKAELPAEEVDRRLSAGLYDAAPQVRRQAMLVAGRMTHTESIPLLVKVMNGETLPTQPLADVPASEKTDVPEGFGDVAEKCSDKEVAALALGIMGKAESKTLIERMQPRTAMADVALALLGEGHRLKPEHFKTVDNNQELQLAAVEAVVRSKGQFGLKLAIDYQQATHWWEEEQVAETLSRMLVAESAPGSRQLMGCKSLDEVRRWFDLHGGEYVARF